MIKTDITYNWAAAAQVLQFKALPRPVIEYTGINLQKTKCCMQKNIESDVEMCEIDSVQMLYLCLK